MRVNLSNRERELLVYRILAGRFLYIGRDGRRYYIYYPSAADLTEFHEQYNYLYRDMIYKGAFTSDEIKRILISTNIMSNADYNELDSIPKLIEKTKEDMYKAYISFKKIDDYKFKLEVLKSRYSEISSKSIQINRCDGDFCARELALFNIFKNSIKFADTNTLLNDDEFRQLSLCYSDVIIAYYESFLDDTTLRYLARTSPWTTIWQIAKVEHKLLNKLPHEYSIPQQELVKWAKFYDGVHDTTESPADEVIEDDDLLDGWAIYQHNKRKEDKKHIVESPVHERANEIFHVVDNEDAARRVYEQNDITGNALNRQRTQLIEKYGTIAEENIPAAVFRFTEEKHG